MNKIHKKYSMQSFKVIKNTSNFESLNLRTEGGFSFPSQNKGDRR